MDKEAIRQAIVEANRLGFKGIQVISYIEPETAAEENRLMLVTTLPEAKSASDNDY